MGLPEVDQDLITELVDEQLEKGKGLLSVYSRPMIELVGDVGEISARWPDPWPENDLRVED